MRRFTGFLTIALGLAAIALFTTRYLMPFRLDDVLLMEWAIKHAWWQAFDPIQGQLVNSYRPIYSLTSYVLTHTAGWAHPFWWHLTLCTTLAVGIGFAALTAAYVSGRWYSAQLTIVLYALAFASILNVFFWFSDLTYGLELAFTTPAWYFGIRGITERRLGFWLLAMLLGLLAVMSKEPAFVLVHVVLLGSLLINRISTLQNGDRSGVRPKAFWVGVSAYALLLGVSLFMVLASPTKGNRFLSLGTPGLWVAIKDRISYYCGVYFGVAPRVLIFFPIVYAYFGRQYSTGRMMRMLVMSVLCLAAALLLFTHFALGFGWLVALLSLLSWIPNPERDRARRFLPFLLCILLAAVALLGTVQEVKTQLTEIAIISAMIASWAWGVWIEDLRIAMSGLESDRQRLLFKLGFAVLAIVGMIAITPRLTREEKMLRAVRDVRWNANDAISWSAEHLPRDATLATCLYQLHGIEHQNLLTARSDSEKLYEQYTFDGGFVYHALENLGRGDIEHAYLADSAMLLRVLPAMRANPNQYLFLQSGLDFALFHGRSPLLTARDTCVMRFSRGGSRGIPPAEIWLLRQ